MAVSMQLKFFCLLLLPAFTAGLAVMSVDFGGEFLKIAIVKPGVPMEIVLNKDSQRKTASLVALKDGERYFGNAALSIALKHPKSAYRYLHDVIGKDFDNPLVTEFRQKHPYYDLERDPDTGSVLFRHDENTKYSPEELAAMILQMAKECAEAFAEQPVTEAVITVPAFFNQAERRAMTRAAELAGLKLLQLVGDNAAVALNYGVFRRKSFNSTPSRYMFFDIGATAAVTTVAEYQVVKTKSPSGITDTFPQLTIKGVGFNRTLGGAELQRRLRDHLGNLFNANRKVKKDVFEDARAMQKLYKEAGRVKQVLSANADHYAQVENLADDEDFRAKVTREEFELLCEDLFRGVGKTVEDALEASQLTMDEINEVILMGGGTRVPKIQEMLKSSIKREELGKGINTDEAAALGAVYQAAHLGKGFKVQKFNLKEAVIYPIQVEFERVKTPGDSDEVSKTVTKTLFGRFQSYPHKKVMTFNKNTKDFSFQMHYGDLEFLSEREIGYLGSQSLTTVSLGGVEEAFAKHSEGEVSKGIKAHFNIDESGLLHVDKVEAAFEKMVQVEQEVEEESTLSKLGKSFSSFFGGKGDEGTAKEGGAEEQGEQNKDAATEPLKSGNASDGRDPTKTGSSENGTSGDVDELEKKQAATEDGKGEKGEAEEAKQEPPTKADETHREEEEKKTSEEHSKGEDKKEEKPVSEEAGKAEEEKKEEKPKVEKKPQLVVTKEPLKVEIKVEDVKDPDQDKLKAAKKHLDDLKKKEEEKNLLEKAKNDIESFVFDTRDKLEQKDYAKCSTQQEREKINEALSAASDWMYEQADDAPRKVYSDKLDELKSLTRDLFERVMELQQRPFFVETLSSRVNHTEFFLAGMANFTGDDQIFTKVEYETLQNLIEETKTWNKTVHKELAKAPLTEKPRFTIDDFMAKINALDREIKYLVNKAKSYKPKPKPKENATKEEAEKQKTKRESESDEQVVVEEEEIPVDEKPLEKEEEVIPELGTGDDKDSSSKSTPASQEEEEEEPKPKKEPHGSDEL